jgi:uncharacterized delta-60 repeat protein
MTKRTFQGIFILSLILGVFTTASGQGELDISFNGTGSVMTDFGVSTSSVASILVQPDQKIVEVGATNQGGFTYFALTRYNPNGSLDTSFGDNGRIVTDFDPNGPTEGAGAAVLQPDGKIIAAGYVALSNPGPSYFALIRYNPDGSVDTSFGNGGKVSTSIVQHVHRISGAALSPDGKIVVAGLYFAGSQTTESLIVRYNPNGSLDTSFSGDGIVTDTRGGNLGDANAPSSVAIQPDGKVITGGAYTRSLSVTGGDVTLVRYNADGTYDFSFGSGGRLLIPSPTVSEAIRAIALLPDGRIVAAGESGADFLLMRFNADGSPDVTFDGDGRLTTAIVNGSRASSLLLRPSGKIFLSGSSSTAAQGIVAASYNADGSLDTSFSGDGKFSLGFAGSFTTGANAMAIDGLNRIILGGTAANKFLAIRLYTLEPTLVSVVGRTITPEGTPIRGVTIGLTNQLGETRWAITSNFGYYRIDGVPTGQTYTLFARDSKRYTFETKVFGLNEAIYNLDLFGEPPSAVRANAK